VESLRLSAAPCQFARFPTCLPARRDKLSLALTQGLPTPSGCAQDGSAQQGTAKIRGSITIMTTSTTTDTNYYDYDYNYHYD